MIRSGTDHWGSLAKFFHWTTVILILVQGTIGLVMVALPKQPSVISVYTFHKSLGLTILLFAALRLTWRLFDPRPHEPPSVPQWQVIGARIGHALLYALIFLVPLSGWWYDSVAALRPLYWFGLVHVPPLGGPDPAQPDLKFIARDRHEFLFWMLMLVAAGHAAMALIHHYHDRDDVLRRMLPQWLTRRRSSANGG
jgi:cytochrome b561